MIILLFPSPMSISANLKHSRNYIENEALVSTADFRAFNQLIKPYLGRMSIRLTRIVQKYTTTRLYRTLIYRCNVFITDIFHTCYTIHAR